MDTLKAKKILHDFLKDGGKESITSFKGEINAYCLYLKKEKRQKAEFIVVGLCLGDRIDTDCLLFCGAYKEKTFKAKIDFITQGILEAIYWGDLC